jgi:uncharacterized damage-inducible protein DinB
MQVTSHIAQHLLDVYTGGNWTEVSVAETLADLTFEEAIKVTAASPNSIASLVHHLSYWNRIMVQRIDGAKPGIPEVNGFDVGTIANEKEWKALIRDLFVSASELALAIKNVGDARLEEPIVNGLVSTYKNLQGSVEHIHYHLGQIVILKKLIRAQ